MTETTYFPDLRCALSPSYREGDVTVEVVDTEGRSQFLHIAKSMTNEESGQHYLAIGLVEIDRRKRRALIELPIEADSGANRMWVRFEDLRREVGVVA